jgi:hypothetical protein
MLRVRMLAPSTVIPIGSLLIGAADEVRRAQADALAADDVHAVIDDLAGKRSVTWYLAIAETTDGFSPRSMAPAVIVRTASIM